MAARSYYTADNLSVDREQRWTETIPWPGPTHNSAPFPARHLSGYFLTLQPRINTATAEQETEVIIRVHQEWLDRGGCAVRDGALSVDGGPLLSVVFPEAEPRRLLSLAALFAVGFIREDWMHDELLCTQSESKNKDSAMKNFAIIINQMKSKAIMEMIDNDPNLIPLAQDYTIWETRLPNPQEPRIPIEIFQSLDQYLEEKYLTIAWPLLSATLPYAYNIRLSKEHLDQYSILIPFTSKIIVLINDIFSAERDWSTHISRNETGMPVSAVYTIMQTQGSSIAEAKKIAQQKALDLEQQFSKLCWELLDNTEFGLRPEATRYIAALQYLVAGTLSWYSGSNRFRVDPQDPFNPRPEYTLSDFPIMEAQTPDISPTSRLERNNTLLSTSTESWNAGRFSRSRDGPPTPPYESDLWVTPSSKISEELVLKPFEYASSMSTRGIFPQVIQGLDYWYNVPRGSLDIISMVVEMLRIAFSILNDLDTESSRGSPPPHLVFGTPQSISAANYLFVKGLREVQKLPHSLSAVEIFTDELANIQLGQGQNAHWSSRSTYPSEQDYIKIIDGKTGGLFRMAARLMRAEATRNQDLDVESLVTNMGRYFEIQNEYQNVSAVQTQRSTSRDELTDALELGKSILTLIHSLCNSRGDNRGQLENLLQLQSRQGKLFPEQKILMARLLSRSGSMDYTLNVSERLQDEIERIMEFIEGSTGMEKNWTMRAIMASTRVR